MANLQVFWAPAPGGKCEFPCVDCGLITGNFCDGGPSVGYDRCFAPERVPHDYNNTGGFGVQKTPLCSYCETRVGFCRFCRGVSSCTPPNRQRHWSGLHSSFARRFHEDQAKLVVAREFEVRERVNRARADEVRIAEAEAAAAAARVDEQQGLMKLVKQYVLPHVIERH